jgi:hypothetical protein
VAGVQTAVLTKKLMAQGEQALNDMRVNAERTSAADAERKRYEANLKEMQEEVLSLHGPPPPIHCR